LVGAAVTHPSVLDVVFGVVALVVAVFYLAVLPSEARKVRDGHPPTQWWRAVLMRRSKDDQRTPEEFAAKYRSQLTRNTRTGLVFGLVIVALDVVFIPFGGKLMWFPLLLGVMFLSQSAGCFRARRILDTPGAA
jgi:hypothetical protein